MSVIFITIMAGVVVVGYKISLLIGKGHFHCGSGKATFAYRKLNYNCARELWAGQPAAFDKKPSTS